MSDSAENLKLWNTELKSVDLRSKTRYPRQGCSEEGVRCVLTQSGKSEPVGKLKKSAILKNTN